ncbi:MAG TPA: acetylornithine transaminase [Propioniciclava sp.]|uniref:acetylornithine transaminase n=1 Tax=Propioniciclava sp. TaxID=2038686 RepID=UPI002BECF2E9|nr:acetylornithine transaminase [Propioniciclava sp.]HRL50009.1 acetylornithine transaminase [Propioniciclava sp.]HRL81320.1 acetylornithine transaminase [Propioniciclava sp.]
MTTMLERYGDAMMNAFGTPQRVLVRGEGPYVWDAEGMRYLDLLGGIAVNALGHCHPRLVAAIADQAGTLMHVSNLFTTPLQIELAERLDALVGEGRHARTFLTNSGSEANEAALKVTRLTGRHKIVAMEGSFHGRTLGALSLTSTEKYRAPFEPLPSGVTWVPYGDAAALADAVDDTTAAVILEPIQGENGVVEPPRGYLQFVREQCDAHGALLWFDEVQTGMGRTGAWLASSAQGVHGDLITLAKGLGGGFPIGACVAVGRAADFIQPGQHGTTFGGNPLASRAALTVLDILESEGLLLHAERTGAWLASSIEGLGLPQISHVRGRGLLRGVVVKEPISADIARRALKRGFIVNAPRPDVLRLAPPLVITTDDLQPFVDALPELVA